MGLFTVIKYDCSAVANILQFTGYSTEKGLSYVVFSCVSSSPVVFVQGEEPEESSSSWMADHTRSHHNSKISPDPREDYDFVVLDQFRKALERQVEEAVRIKFAMAKGFLMLGHGRKSRKIKLNKMLLNRKIENFSPWFLTMGGGGQD